MAFQQLAGRGLWIPDPTAMWGVTPSFASMTIDATGEKAAFCGRVWFPARTGTKNISRLGFRFGTIVKAGGSALTASLQDFDPAAGPPANPDGTQDQTVAIANADASFASNTWIRTGTLSSDRTVSYGDFVCFVLEFDGSGRQGADSVTLSYLFTSGDSSNCNIQQSQVSLNTGSWASQTGVPNLILEFSDGAFGCLDCSFPCSAINSHAFNVNTAGADEYALAFTLPFPVKIDALWAVMSFASVSSAFDIVLYEGTTAIITTSFNPRSLAIANTRQLVCPITETELSANTTYYLAIKPTSTNNVTVFSFDVSDANHLVCHGGGTSWNYTTRLNSGSWEAVTTTRSLVAGIKVSSIQDGVGGGGGFIPGVLVPFRI